MSAIQNPVPAPQNPSPRPVLAPTPDEPESKRSWVAWGVALVLIVGGVQGWRWYSARQEAAALAALPAVKTITARNGALQQNVRVTGVTTARNFSNMAAPKLTGPEGNRPMTILMMVPNGSMVRKGQKILEIDGQSLQDHIDDLAVTVTQAEGDIQKRLAEQALDIENLQQSVRVAKSELDKVNLDLKAKELRTPLDQELIQLSAEEADAKYRQLVREVDMKKQSQASELSILKFTKDRHARHMARHGMDLKKFAVVSQMDGMAVVQSIFRGGEYDSIKVGDVVAPGQLVLKVVDPSSMQLEGNINQTEVSQFRIGEKASISLDAFPGLNFEGKLYSVGALAVAGSRQQGYIRTIPIRVAIDGHDQKLIPDLSAAADVTTGLTTENAIVLPRGAVHEDGGKAYVFAKTGSSFTKREVTLGVSNQTEVAISSGVRAGEEIALNYSQPTQVASR